MLCFPQHVYEYERKQVDPTKDKSRCFQWGQVLATLRDMKQKLDHHDCGTVSRPRLYHDFLILLLFTSVSPSRNMDLVKLRIAYDHEPTRRQGEEESNWMVFYEDGKTEMVVRSFKTSKTYGCNRVVISDYEFVDRYLRDYVQTARPRLIGDKQHSFLFTRQSGDPFHTSQAFSTYLDKAFNEHSGGLTFTTTNLRKSLVNWLMEHEKDEGIRQSVARLMSHSTRVQRLRYNTMESAQKIRKAADHLSSYTKGWLGLKSTTKLGTETFLPFRDQVVAMVADNSTNAKPVILLGKVIGFNMEQNTVSMAELVTAGALRHYQMQIGSVWEEQLDRIVHPIDVSYIDGENVYVLRTPEEDIHRLVMDNRNATSEDEA